RRIQHLTRSLLALLGLGQFRALLPEAGIEGAILGGVSRQRVEPSLHRGQSAAKLLGLETRGRVLGKGGPELLEQRIELGSRWAPGRGRRREGAKHAVPIIGQRNQPDAGRGSGDGVGTWDRDTNRDIVWPVAGGDGQGEEQPGA